MSPFAQCNLAPEADPEGKENETNIEPERLFADVEKIITEFTQGRDVLKAPVKTGMK